MYHNYFVSDYKVHEAMKNLIYLCISSSQFLDLFTTQ